MKRILAILLMVTLLLLAAGCSKNGDSAQLLLNDEGEKWYCGFSSRQIEIPDEGPLYIAGYHNGVEIRGVRDLCEAKAVWLDTGGKGTLLIGIDCVGLDSGTVEKIRASLADLPNCAGVQVYSTHTHAGIDTLGLWGQIGIDGKNPGYQENLLKAAEEAGREAAANRKAGTMYYGFVETKDMFRDSRDPQVYDSNLYQLRFAPEDGGRGLRMYIYGAHAESLRAGNTKVSRDFPGVLCDGVTEATGDSAMFMPGAIGGLVMTKSFVEGVDEGVKPEKNMQITGDLLIGYALSIESERQLSPEMKLSRAEFDIPMDNPIFLLYKSLGILNNRAVKADSATGYGVRTELSLLMLDDMAVCLMPGEIFPELVFGGTLDPGKDPTPLVQLAKEHGIDHVMVVGLANDEIGYIVSPSDYLVNPKIPYLERITDRKGEDHYEETNSVGPKCAERIAEAFVLALKALG